MIEERESKPVIRQELLIRVEREQCNERERVIEKDLRWKEWVDDVHIQLQTFSVLEQKQIYFKMLIQYME